MQQLKGARFSGMSMEHFTKGMDKLKPEQCVYYGVIDGKVKLCISR